MTLKYWPHDGKFILSIPDYIARDPEAKELNVSKHIDDFVKDRIINVKYTEVIKK
jgi:hypothetical protein